MKSEADNDALQSNIKLLLIKEGLRGYGAYCYMRDFLNGLPEKWASVSVLVDLARQTGTQPNVMRRVLYQYDLFCVKGEWFGMTLTYAVPTNVDSAQKTKNPASTKKVRVEVRVDAPMDTRVDAPMDARVEAPMDTRVDAPMDALMEAPVESRSNKVDKCQIIKTKRSFGNCFKRASKMRSSHVRTRVDVVDDNIGEDKKRNANNNTGHENSGCNNPSFLSLIDALQSDDDWLEQIWSSTRLEKKHLDYLPQIIDNFKNHIRTYDKEQELPDLKAVRRYFVNFLSPDSRTGRRIRDLLVTWQASRGSSAISPFEQLIEGRRAFMGGIPIPDDAPPRPSISAFWDDGARKWIG